MTPLEVTVQTLEAHDLILSPGGYWNCRCGLPMDAKGGHAAHQADMLAAAGVLPGIQEWGVPNSSGHMIVGNTPGAVDHYSQTYNRPISTRHVTSWVEVGR